MTARAARASASCPSGTLLIPARANSVISQARVNADTASRIPEAADATGRKALVTPTALRRSSHHGRFRRITCVLKSPITDSAWASS